MSFFKLAHPTGWDFYTFDGKKGTINYRENIGKRVVCPGYNRTGNLCSSMFIHASRKPNQCFIGASIPCSAYLVTGRPVREDADKCGFKSLRILEELKPEELFTWNYKEACNPINPFQITPPPKISKKHIKLLRKWASVWDSVGASVGASVWASVGASVWASVWASVGDSVWDSVWDSVGAVITSYTGSLFPLQREEWKYTEKIQTSGYPFQSAVDLWKLGLVPSYDGETWRLHSGEDAKVLWEGGLDG